MSIESSEIQRIIAILEAGTPLTSEDRQVLAAALKSQQITVATGDRAVSIGGSADEAVLMIGNKNILTYSSA